MREMIARARFSPSEAICSSVGLALAERSRILFCVFFFRSTMMPSCSAINFNVSSSVNLERSASKEPNSSPVPIAFFERRNARCFRSLAFFTKALNMSVSQPLISGSSVAATASSISESMLSTASFTTSPATFAASWIFGATDSALPSLPRFSLSTRSLYLRIKSITDCSA